MEVGSSPTRARRLTQWVIWALPVRVMTPVLLVELTTIGLITLDLLRGGIGRAELFAAGMLCVLGVVHTEIAVGVERLRRQVADAPHGDLSSVWTFAGAVLLPPALTTGVVVVIFAHQWLRVWRSVGVPAYRHIFSTATVILACHAALAVVHYNGSVPLRDLDGPRQLLTLVLAILAYVTVNTGLVASAIAVSAPRPRPRPVQLIGHWDDNVLEIATLCLGGLVAVALWAHPWQVPLVMAPLLVLHRAVLVRQLEEVASTDGKTGLLTAAAWHSHAAKELRRAQRAQSTAALLILDLDHFKSVNDDHGHLAGDQVLSAIAAALRGEVREHDLVGRFGGEEFVVLLPGMGRDLGDAAELYAIAERIRHRISTLSVVVTTARGSLTIAGLSVSVGGAVFPDHGTGLEHVLQAADTALYEAKRDGRNAVRIADDVTEVPRQRSAGRRY
ncbi:MAG TPA: GGDEF domain-containing protein [Pseudonocardia sp.]